MACALCHKNRTLRRSHIVPEFMYQAMYDPKHRFQGLSSVPSARARLYQKGLRQELLCEQCEQQFGRYESYATQVFYGGVSVVGQRRGNKLLLSSLDYKRLKLFFLSLLWRFGVTSIDVFRGADLGPHSEKLRKMLLVEDPGDCFAYPCLVTAVTWQRKHIGDLIAPPCLAKMEGHRIWWFIIAGFVFTFFVSSHLPPVPLLPGFLQKDGSLLIAIREITEIDFLYRFACELRDAQKTKKG